MYTLTLTIYPLPSPFTLSEPFHQHYLSMIQNFSADERTEILYYYKTVILTDRQSDSRSDSRYNQSSNDHSVSERSSIAMGSSVSVRDDTLAKLLACPICLEICKRPKVNIVDS